MSEDTTPKAPEFDASAAFEQLMGPGSGEPTHEVAPANPDLMAELTGERPSPDSTVEPSGDTEESDLEEHSGLQDVLEKLQRAQQDAGKAGERLGSERKARQKAEERLAQLEAQMLALQNGQQAPPQQQNDGAPQVELLSRDQIDDYVATLMPDYMDSREDFITKAEAAQMAVNAAYHAAQAAMGQVGGVMGTIEHMKFDQELAGLGISRGRFDAIWEDPAMSWGKVLSDDQRLAALKSQAVMPGTGLSAPVPSAQAGAPPTSRVADPRRTIETHQGAGSAQNPRRLATLKLDQALEAGDSQAARAAAAPLFGRLLGQ